jgi:hypothetical protein
LKKVEASAFIVFGAFVLIITLTQSSAAFSPLPKGVASSTVSYPLATIAYVRIDPHNNRWYANITNEGSRAVSIVVLILNNGVWEAVHRTNALASGRTIRLSESCYDPYLKKKCNISQANALEFSAATSDSYYQYQFNQNVRADNLIHSVGNYPRFLIGATLSISSSNWNATITNLGTQSGSFKATIQWTYRDCKSPPQCYPYDLLKAHYLTSGHSFSEHRSIKYYSPTRGDSADIQATSSYSAPGYTAYFLAEKYVPVK